MTSETLSYIIAVAELKSITKAAQSCLISQPALSQSIREVEEELGVTLFTRRSHGVELTDGGRIFVNNSRAMLYTEEQMVKAISSLKKNESRHLDLFLEEKIKNQVSKTWLGVLKESFPHLEIMIQTGSTRDGIAYLLQGLSEISIFYAKDDYKKGLEYHTLEKVEYLLAIPLSNPCLNMVKDNIENIRNLECQTFILNSARSEFRSFQHRIMETYNLYPKNRLESDNVTTIQAMLNSGLGIGFLPEHMSPGNSSGYECFSLPEPFFYQIILACRRNQLLSPPAKALKDLILSHTRTADG